MWGLVVFLIGIVYGWWKPGRQDKMDILKTGVVVGIVLAIVFALLGVAVNFNPLGLELGTGMLGTLLAIIVLTVVFILGVFIGDWIEGMRTPRMGRTV